MKFDLPRPQLRLLVGLEKACLDAIKNGDLDKQLTYLTPELTIEEFISVYTSNYTKVNSTYEILEALQVNDLIDYTKMSITKLDDIAFFALRKFFDASHSFEYLVDCIKVMKEL